MELYEHFISCRNENCMNTLLKEKKGKCMNIF